MTPSLPTNPCLLDGPHDAHDWWYTSSGGGHMLDSYDPTEKNCRQHHCPGKPAPAPAFDAFLARKLEDPEIRTAYDAARTRAEHAYVSTACYHDLHSRCRRTCKFCETPCRCECHAPDGAV